MTRLLTALPLALLLLAPAAGQEPRAANDGQLAETNRKIRELADAKKYAEALKLAESAVEEAARLFGPDSVEVSAQLSVLSSIYFTRHDLGKTKKTVARMLELRERRPGPSQNYERDALVLYTCLIAADLHADPDRSVAERISRVLTEDSVLDQGFSLSPQKKELQVGALDSKPQPAFPGEAKMTRTSGAAVMLLSVDETGRVTDVTPVGCSAPVFIRPGAAAAKRATFKPTTVNGKPIKVRSIIFYRWVIQ